MSYATNKLFAEKSGLGLRIVDENVGTGDESNKTFDLKNNNIVSDTYVLNHAVSGSNDFTALVETTDYVLDKESGKILLTAAGVTELGTDILYATYWYTDEFTDEMITELLLSASEEIDLATRKNWGTEETTTEYQDGRSRSKYPTTDRPYANDYTPDCIIRLRNPEVTKINQMYFLNPPVIINKCFNYDDGTSAYSDKTDDVNSFVSSTVIPFDDSPTADDYFYVGSTFPFLGLDINLYVDGTGTPAITWEYYNGTSWTTLSVTDVTSGVKTFTASGKMVWNYPPGWEKTSVNSESYYYVRGKLTAGFTISPQINVISINDSVKQVLLPSNIILDSNGIIRLNGLDVPDGSNNIRIDYDNGMSSTPEYIKTLNVLVASVYAYVKLSGGSYDAATSYNLGSKSVTIGEQYVNIREVLSQFDKKIQNIYSLVGKRAYISVI